MKKQMFRTLGGIVPVVIMALTSVAPAYADQSITTQIDAITARSAVAANSWSMLVSDASGSVTYYQKNQTTTEAPASNMKIVTSSAAFGLLGTTSSFVTTVYRNGTFSSGTVTGDVNLLVKHDITWNDNVFGTGNARKPLDFIATQLKAQGITKITGKVQIYGACMYNHADTDDTRDIQNQATYNGEGAAAFKAALQAQGITVSGVSAGVAGFSAPGTLIYTYNSTSLTYGGSPLRLDVACIPMNKVSHNVMADLLLRHISYELTGSDSFTSGATKVFGWLNSTVGLATNDMVMLDGSGLSHSDRMSAKEINTITRYMLAHFSTWSTTLPIGCVDGTLGSRFCGTDGSGRVHAKTGSLSITISLSGYVDNKYNGQRYYFSFLVNNGAGIDQANTRQALDDAVNVVAGVIPTTIDSYAGNDGNRALDIALPTSSNTTEVDAESGANGSFTGWTSIAGPTGSGAAPVVGYQADQRIRLFLRGSDNNVWTVIKALNGAWGSWSSLGGNVRSSVSVGYLANGAMQLFARSSSNTVITSIQSAPNGTFGAWSDLGGQCYDDPLVTANADGRFQLFTRSAANTVYSNFKTTSGTWFGWSDYGGSCMGKPQGGQWTNGVIVVLTRTSSSTVRQITQTGPNGGWGAWTDLGGTAASDPVITYNADGRMQFFVQTPTHTVSMNFRVGLATNSTWFGWLSLGGTSYSNLGTGINADGTIHVFTRDANRVVWSAWQTNANSSFTGWSSLGGNTLSAAMTTQTASQPATDGSYSVARVVTTDASQPAQSTQLTQRSTADGSITLPCISTWARVFQVQYSEDSGSSWTNLSDPVLVNGHSITVNDSSAAHTRRSYRVIVVQ
jgi:D-alanyl-D-alanine carboxypeptidase